VQVKHRGHNVVSICISSFPRLRVVGIKKTKSDCLLVPLTCLLKETNLSACSRWTGNITHTHVLKRLSVFPKLSGFYRRGLPVVFDSDFAMANHRAFWSIGTTTSTELNK